MSETEKLVTYYSCWYVKFSFRFEKYENVNILKFENFFLVTSRVQSHIEVICI